jgi:DNA (cytosine-5)-methyltransferase 1
VALHTISLCSGVGMLDLGLEAGLGHLGIVARTVVYVEREAYAASQLVALMEAGLLPAAPVWSDLATFDGCSWRGVVDCLVAGLPCQPYSVAGKQQGLSDSRSFGDGDGPIPHAVRIIAESRPALVWLENVPPWVRGGFFRPVGEELCRMGYAVAEPIFLAASDVGASHRRERVFVLAYCPHRGRRILRESSGRGGLVDGGDARMGDAGLQHGDLQQRGARAKPAGANQQLAESDGTGQRSGGQCEQGQIPDQPGPQLADAGHQPAWPQQQVAVAGRCCAADDCVCSAGLANARDGFVPQSRRGSQGRNGTGSAGPHVADSRSPRRTLAKPETVQRKGGGYERRTVAELCGASLFAPGPSDGRWPDIIARKPWLAPATESGVRMLVDGASLMVDEQPRHQLRAVGNGAVPAVFAAAVVTLARGIM